MVTQAGAAATLGLDRPGRRSAASHVERLMRLGGPADLDALETAIATWRAELDSRGETELKRPIGRRNWLK